MKCNFDKNRIIDMVNLNISDKEQEVIEHIDNCIECQGIYKQFTSAKNFYATEMNPSNDIIQYVMHNINKDYHKRHKAYSHWISFIHRHSMAIKASSIIAASFILMIIFTHGKEFSNYINDSHFGFNNNQPEVSSISHPTQIEMPTSDNGITLSEIDGKNFKGKILTIKDPRRIAVGYASNLETGNRQTTSEIAKLNGAIAAINAGGYCEGDNLTDIPDGIIFSKGNVIYNSFNSPKFKTSVAAFTQNGILEVGNYSIEDMKKNNIMEAISFNPPLVLNGKPTIKKGDGGWGLAPRTAIGQKKNGEVVFLVIDGRSLNSLGATLRDVQDILIEQGVVNALNLDGGSSTTMYYNGKVINNPSSDKGERTVSSVFMVMP